MTVDPRAEFTLLGPLRTPEIGGTDAPLRDHRRGLDRRRPRRDPVRQRRDTMNAPEAIIDADRTRLADCAIELGEITVSLKEFAEQHKYDPVLAAAAARALVAGEAANAAFMLATQAHDLVPIKTPQDESASLKREPAGWGDSLNLNSR